MPFFRGAGGVVWDLDVPAEGTNRREQFDAQVASGELVPVGLEPVAPVAEPEPEPEPAAEEPAEVPKRRSRPPKNTEAPEV